MQANVAEKRKDVKRDPTGRSREGGRCAVPYRHVSDTVPPRATMGYRCLHDKSVGWVLWGQSSPCAAFLHPWFGTSQKRSKRGCSDQPLGAAQPTPAESLQGLGTDCGQG